MSWFADQAPMIGLLFFFGFFTVMALWVYTPARRAKLESHGEIPLNDEVHNDR